MVLVFSIPMTTQNVTGQGSTYIHPYYQVDNVVMRLTKAPAPEPYAIGTGGTGTLVRDLYRRKPDIRIKGTKVDEVEAEPAQHVCGGYVGYPKNTSHCGDCRDKAEPKSSYYSYDNVESRLFKYPTPETQGCSTGGTGGIVADMYVPQSEAFVTAGKQALDVKGPVTHLFGNAIGKPVTNASFPY